MAAPSRPRKAAPQSFPRSRGHLVAVDAGPESQGSSPHARGAPGSCFDRLRGLRAHPRVRGEHVPGVPSALVPPGSSPRARGALLHVALELAVRGLIPACAGSTTADDGRHAILGAHPRVRGEHSGRCGPWPLPSGSSPHARGARPRGCRRPTRDGLIPACAGSTGGPPFGTRGRRAHPPMRGEHPRPRLRLPRTRGSSPHARGAHFFHRYGLTVRGLIPACAGSTDTVDDSGAITGAHPRMRGEHWCGRSRASATGGSSPHARGAHFLTCGFSAPNPVFHSLSTAVPR